MLKYTVAMATHYNDSWHLDYSTESAMMDEQSVIIEGHKLTDLGAFPLYTEYKNGVKTNIMIEWDNRLVLAFGM